ncbi:MAG TPA: sigma-70 family RNA polymerase sigma factor [Bacillota bacterium]|nr:sigma-70 family RNA polymerase sigma factor [Bacillota bacterium]
MNIIELDEQIVRGIINKDKNALALLVDTYGSLIKSIVGYHLSSLKLYQEECINDVLLSIWQNMKRFDKSKNSLKNWIGAICKYKCIDYKRKYCREICFAELDENIPDDKYEFESILNSEIDSLLEGLDPRDRELFYRHYILGENIEHIAAQISKAPSILYNRLSRGRRKLRQILQRSGY